MNSIANYGITSGNSPGPDLQQSILRKFERLNQTSEHHNLNLVSSWEWKHNWWSRHYWPFASRGIALIGGQNALAGLRDEGGRPPQLLRVWIGPLKLRRHHNLLWRWAGAPLMNRGGLAGAVQPWLPQEHAPLQASACRHHLRIDCSVFV